MRVSLLPGYAERSARMFAIGLGFSVPISVALDNALLVLILVAWLASGRLRDTFMAIRHNPAAQAAAALFALLAAGMAYSAAAPGDAFSTLGKYADLAFVPIFIVLFREARARDLAWVAMGSALALTLILSWIIWLGAIEPGGLMPGSRANPVVFKQYLTQGILLAFAAFLFALLAQDAGTAGRRYAWMALAVAAALNVVLLSLGRTGQLVLLCLALYFGYAVRRWIGVVVAVAVAATVFAAHLTLSGLSPAGSPVEDRAKLAVEEALAWQPDLPAQTSVGMRLEFYRTSLVLIAKNPMFGTGTGGFAKAYADEVAGTDMVRTTNPHNEYLNIAIQLGAAGLLALLWMFITVWRFASKLPTARDTHLARGLVITFAVGCLFNSLLLDHVEGLWFAWACGLLFAGLPGRRLAEVRPS